MDKNYQTDMIVLDFAKAFDKVSHPRLLHKLEHYGIRTKEDQVLLQNDLNKLIKWEGKWKMSFNVDKCNVMHITRARTGQFCNNII